MSLGHFADDEQIVQIQTALAASVTLKRYTHSLSVVKCAIKLAGVYKVDLRRCVIAALLHDCGREINVANSIAYALGNDIKVDSCEKAQPVLLHAKIGAHLAKTKYKITDDIILKAIKQHTTGAKKMSNVSMVVFLADMLEDSRVFADVEALRKLIGKVTLEELLLKAHRVNFNYLFEKNLLLHPASIKSYNSLLKSFLNISI